MSEQVGTALAGERIYWTGRTEGWALIFAGHGHDTNALIDAASDEFGTRSFVTEEAWLQRHKRVMWCERIDGFGCDNNGEWHAHWSGVRPNVNESTKWTVVTPTTRGAGA